LRLPDPHGGASDPAEQQLRALEVVDGDEGIWRSGAAGDPARMQQRSGAVGDPAANLIDPKIYIANV
jgi:hypothetical protein